MACCIAAAVGRCKLRRESTTVTFPGNVNVNTGLDVTGHITVTGNVDGVDLAKTLKHTTTGYNSGNITVSATAPVSPAQGDIWFDTDAELAATTLGGLGLNTTDVNNQVDKVMRTQSNGYAYFGWINTVSGTATAAEPARIYCSQDAFIRYMTASNFRTYVIAPYYLTKASPTFTGTLTGPSAEMTDLGLNTNPGEGDLRVGGYGIMGSRAGSVVYVTNASTTGSVAINTGGVHGSTYNRAVFSNAGVYIPGVINLGHASDTTIARNAAGKVEIENKPIIKHASTTYESGEVTFSTSAATGGSNGDIWFQYT